MKSKDKKEIFTKSENELKKALTDARHALLDLTLDLKQNKLKNTRQIFWKKKEIAWILTALTENKLINKEKEKHANSEKVKKEK